MQPNRYLAVRTHADDTWSLFYVVDTATGMALTTHGTWGDALEAAELANAGDLPDRWQCSQCKRILPDGALVGTCPECRGNRLERAT